MSAASVSAVHRRLPDPKACQRIAEEMLSLAMERVVFPLSGSKAFNVLPAANQTC